jgi:hypothetical protein
MPPRFDNSELVNALLELSGIEFIEVLRRVFEKRDPDTESVFEERFVLGIAILRNRVATDPRVKEIWEKGSKEIRFVPYITWGSYSQDFVVPDGFYEFGGCSNCGIEVTASYQSASCPICGRHIRLT